MPNSNKNRTEEVQLEFCDCAYLSSFQLPFFLFRFLLAVFTLDADIELHGMCHTKSAFQFRCQIERISNPQIRFEFSYHYYYLF